MNLDNPLLLGIILIATGIAVALIAASILLNRRDMGKTQQETPKEEDTTGHPDTKALHAHAEDGSESSTAPRVAAPAEVKTTALSDPQEQDILQPVAEPEPPEESLAAFRRDPDTGQLILSVGGHEYASREALQSSADWALIENSLSEFLAWLPHPAVPAPPPQAPPPLSNQPDTALQRKGRNKKSAPVAPPRSMVEQINDIIQEKIRTSEDPGISVRLIEGLHGEIKAIIGVESFLLEEIPSPQVREVIRQSVAEWERKT